MRIIESQIINKQTYDYNDSKSNKVNHNNF